jgi:hypothetical protein
VFVEKIIGKIAKIWLMLSWKCTWMVRHDKYLKLENDRIAGSLDCVGTEINYWHQRSYLRKEN